MKPELRRYHAVQMSLRTTLVLTEDQVTKITSISSPDPEGDCLFVEVYTGHRAWAWLRKPKKAKRGGHTSEVAITFQAKGIRRVRKRVPHIAQLVDILASSNNTYDFRCNVSFMLGRKLKPTSVFGLPLKPPKSAKLPFSSIAGVHATKTIGKGRTCDVMIEASNGTIAADILMPYSSPLDGKLADSALQRANSIFTEFVQVQTETNDA